MADVKDLLIRMSLDTMTFKQKITEAKSELKALKAEFKAAESGDEVGKAGGTLLKNLQDQKAAAEALVKEYQKGMDDIRKKLDTAVPGSQKATQLQTEASRLETAFNNAKTTVNELQSQIDGFRMENFIYKAEQLATVFMSLKLGLGDILRGAGEAADSADDAFVRREAAFISATKNVEDAHQTKQDLEALNASLREMATQIPQTYEQLAGLMGVGATLGVPYENLLKFTEIMAKLNVATNVEGEGGAQAMAQFLNITEKGYDHLDRVGAALTELGNNSATTEQNILEMAHRAATGLATVGMGTQDILALSAAINSVGIEAQAGGSSISKLGISMDKAANVGAQNIQRLLSTWGDESIASIYDLYAGLDSLGSKGWREMEEKLGMTAADTKALMNSALAAERFSKAMGMTADQFSAGWNQDAAAQMLSFFRTLGEMDGTSDEENMLWVMDQLGIKEIRQSNMVRALANNWELYANMLQLGRDAYEENIALENEANRAFSTNESRRTMNQNKEQNALDAMGETVTAMRKPFEDFFGDLKQWYADWPTWAKTAVAGATEVMGGAGEVLNTAGQLAFDVVNVSKAVQMLNNTGLGAKLITGAKVGAGVLGGVAAVGAAGYGLYALGQYLGDLADKTDEISASLGGLEIVIDPVSKEATLAAIQEVKDAADGLNGENLDRYANTSQVVKMGYGTSGMFGQALAYEQYAAQRRIEGIYDEFGGYLRTAEQNLISAGDDEGRRQAQQTITALEAMMRQRVAEAQAQYGQALNEVMNGALERTGQGGRLESLQEMYHALDSLLLASQEHEGNILGDWYMPENWKDIAAILERSGYTGAGLQNGAGGALSTGDYADMIQYLYGELAKAAGQATQNGEVMSILNAMLSSEALENADTSQFSGALLGLLEAMDIKSIASQNTEKWTEIGQNSMMGLGNGITTNQGLATGAAAQDANDVTAAAAAVLGIHSPSTAFADIGVNIDAGLAAGIYAGADQALQAAAWLAGEIENTMRAALDIHSPSGVARMMGGYFAEGMAEGLEGGVQRIASSADRMASAAAGMAKPSSMRFTLNLDGRKMAEGLVPLVDDALGEAVIFDR